MKEKKIEVSKIVINIGDKESALTVEQARQLRDILNDLLGEKVIEKVIEHDRWYPYYPYYPYITYVSSCWTVTVDDPPKMTTTNGNTSGSYTINLNGNSTPVN